MNHLSVETISAVERYSVRCVAFDAADESVFSQWRLLHKNCAAASSIMDPEWLRGYYDGQTNDLLIYLLYESDVLCGVAPFIRRDWPVALHLGEFTVGHLPLKRLRLLGGALDFPPKEAAYDALFNQLAQSTGGFDALYLEEVPLDSFLWTYVQTSPLVRQWLRIYSPEPPAARPLIRLRGTFDEYMKQFSTRHRHNLRRRVTKFCAEASAEVKWVRYTTPEEVDAFLDLAVAVSRKTYQWNLFKRGLYAIDMLKKRFVFAAEHGWFRSYILFCGSIPCAFVAGFQHEGRFEHHEIGYDPDWKRYAVGTVLHMYMIEDLFTHNRPEVLDFGDYGGYKEEFANDSYTQGKLFLFKRGTYCKLVQAAHRSCQLTTKALSSLLERMDLKNKLKRQLRKWRGLR